MNNTFLYILTVLIWGSTWIAINFQLGEVPPEASLVYRFGLAAIVLMAYCRWKQLSLQFELRAHIQFFLFGLTLFGCNYYFLYVGQHYINSALTCIAFSCIMFFNIINARIWFKTPITRNVIIGAVIGIAGIATLFWPEINDTQLGQHTFYGLMFCLLAVTFASTGNMIAMKNQQKNYALLPATAWGMTYGASFMAVMMITQGKSFTFDWSFPYVSSLLFLSIFGSVIAFASYLTLLNTIGAHRASYASIMFPGVAVVLSTLFEGFQWSEYTVVGFICIVIGNIVVLAKPKDTPASKQSDQSVTLPATNEKVTS